MTEICLQVDGLDLDDGSVSEVLASRFGDCLWARVDGVTTVTVYLEGHDVVPQVSELARAIEHALPKVRVTRVHRDLVTQSDIASRVGVSRQAVRKWTFRQGGDVFPTPFGIVGGGDKRPSKVWQWPEIVIWLRRVYHFDLDEELPDAGTVAEIDARLQRMTTSSSPCGEHGNPRRPPAAPD